MEDLHGIIGEFLEGNIKALGGTPTIEAKSITENGTYNAPEGVDGFNPVTVNVPIPEPVIDSISIFGNGEYIAPEGIDGYSPVIVDIQPELERLVITENGIYTPSQGYDGIGQVTVNIQGGVNVYTETYIGNGTAGHVITFEHEPKAILRISGAIDSSNICWTVGTLTPECNKLRVNVGDSSQYTINIALSGDTMTLLQTSYDAGANLNYNGVTYTVTYLA